MYCPKCGAQLPDDALFCMKCGATLAAAQPKQTTTPTTTTPILAPFGATSLKCPSCGAPISPQFGEMVITCAYCGTGVTLGNDGWKGIRKQTMLPLSFVDKEKVVAEIHGLMDKGLLRRHLQENSTLEEMNLSLIPYWVISVSARTSIIATDMAVTAGSIGTEAALIAVMMGGMGGGFGRRRGRFFMAGPVMGAGMGGAMMGAGMGGGGAKKTYEMDNNYNFPIVALKSLTEYQPKDYQFNLGERTLFDVSKVPKGIKILNGDIGEEAANYQAKTLVAQLQSDKAHDQYHMIQQLHTEIDVAEAELLHVPIWFVLMTIKATRSFWSSMATQAA